MDNNEQPAVIPVVDEELVTGSRAVKTGAVRVRKKVDRTRKVVEAPAIHDVVDVKRVPLNRVIDALPEMREEGDLLIIPVVEEEIIVQKRLVLKEEIHIRRRRTRQRVRQEVSVDRERAIIERIDADGRVVGRSEPDTKAQPSPGRHRSLLR